MQVFFILLGFQILGFAAMYFVLKKRIDESLNINKITEKINSEINAILIEINRTTVQNIDLLEDRISTLKELLVAADKKLSVLKAEKNRQKRGEEVYSHIIKTGQTEEKKIVNFGRESVSDQVLRMYKEGFSPDLIANRLGTTVGEVELIISLKGKSN